jgi:tryptophan-rich sensory protein
VLASFAGWNAAPDDQARGRWVLALGVNGLLNIAWSLLFFYKRRPDLALAEVALLWVSIAVLMGMVWRWSPSAALLLVPYLAWVTFASLLNLEIVRMNALS